MASEVILGIDPGLVTTGWGIVRTGTGGRVTYVDAGKIGTTARLPMGQRLEKIFRELQRVVDHYHVTGCAVEAGYVGPNPVTALHLGHARAAAILAAETRGVPVITLAPREVKMAITGRGAAGKEQVAYVVGKMLGLAFEAGEEDVSDALAVALCRILGRQRALTEKTAE